MYAAIQQWSGINGGQKKVLLIILQLELNEYQINGVIIGLDLFKTFIIRKSGGVCKL